MIYFGYAVLAAAVSLSGTALCYSLFFSTDQQLALISVVGVVVTAVAFCFGTYYAVLAVSAYAHLKEIESIKTDSHENLRKICALEDQMHRTIQAIYQGADGIFEAVQTTISVAESLKPLTRSNLEDQLRFGRARLNLANPNLPDERKLTYMLELFQCARTPSDKREAGTLLKRLVDADDPNVKATAAVLLTRISLGEGPGA